MFSLTLLLLNIALFLYLMVYGLCFLLLPFVRASKPTEQKPNTAATPSPNLGATENYSVSVLVPCHHEGPALVGTVRSLIDQDFAGRIEIVVLMKDSTDTSFKPLEEQFHFGGKKGQSKFTLFESGNRKVILVCTGHQQKKDKLNSYLPKVESTYLAFLDADHRAKSDWISNSISVLDENPSACGVQSRRAPLSLQKLAQIWDSAQNHIGNELVNVALNRVVGSVFFTGTSCLFRTERLHGRKFGDCVTEDTYLSYQLLKDKEKIVYTSDSGTNEEVSPDIHSYVARRRRWSCGHNKTFFDLAPGVLKAGIDWRAKAAVLIHGLFYTVPVAVCLLLNVYALHLFVQYTKNIQLLIGMLALVFASVITLLMFGKHRSVVREIIVLWFWIFPQLTLFFPFVLYHMEHELYFFLTLFPYLRYIIWTHVFCLLAPFTLLLFGSRRVRVLQFHQLLLLFLSYPLFFFLDLWACLLGFSDFLFGRPTWAKIQRTFAEDMIREENHSQSFWIISRWTGASALLVFVIVSFNDLTADSNCGQANAVLFEPKLFLPSSDVSWELQEERSLEDENTIRVKFTSSFSNSLPSQFEVAHKLDGQVVDLSTGDGSSQLSYSFVAPLGWEPHRYEAVLHAKGFLCKRRQDFTTTLRQLKDRKLFLNGEEFLVKGIIPSFSPAQENLTPEAGLRQIREAGANTVRYYHELRKEIKDAVAANSLLVVDQPDRSTWNDINLSLKFHRTGLEDRFERLVQENRNFPFQLFHTLGNEIEILSPKKDIPLLIETMNDLLKKKLVEFFSYSTFFVFIKFPSAIYGVNMLDSSQTYWTAGLESLKSLEKPFYASEFGGFVAFFEWTPPELRMLRLGKYWQDLLAAGGFGAIIHQSHDNWAQPVVEGYNDPLSPDQPDDLRGVWDKDNKPKSFLSFVERIFSDFAVQVADTPIEEQASFFQLTLKNRRPYTLSNVNLYQEDGSQVLVGNLNPGETKTVSLRIPAHRNERPVYRATYSTHHGLQATSQIHLRLPMKKDQVVILNEDLLEQNNEANACSGRLLQGGALTFLAPTTWGEIQVAEKTLKNTGMPLSIEVRKSVEETKDFEISSDGNNWKAGSIADVGTGPQRIRFRLTRDYPPGSVLLLAGLGTDEYWIKVGDGEWKQKKAHNYRENIVPLDELGLKPDQFISLLLPRTKTVFLSKEDSPRGERVDIHLESPKVFSPVHFRIQRASA